MKHVSRVTLLLLLSALLLASCAELQTLVKPQSFDQKWAASMADNTLVRSAATQAAQAKKLTKADQSQVLVLNDQARKLLDEANAAHKAKDPALADAKLSLASSVLLSARQYLKDRGVSVPQ